MSCGARCRPDIFGCEVVSLEVEEGPAFGAALLAIAANQDAAGVTAVSENCVKIKSKRQPIAGNVKIYKEYYDVYRGMYERMKSDMHTLTRIATR